MAWEIARGGSGGERIATTSWREPFLKGNFQGISVACWDDRFGSCLEVMFASLVSASKIVWKCTSIYGMFRLNFLLRRPGAAPVFSLVRSFPPCAAKASGPFHQDRMTKVPSGAVSYCVEGRLPECLVICAIGSARMYCGASPPTPVT